MMIKGTKFFVTFICVMSTGGQPSADPIDITQIKVTNNFVSFTIHNVVKIFLVYSILHNEKALTGPSNYGNNADRNENNVD